VVLSAFVKAVAEDAG